MLYRVLKPTYLRIQLCVPSNSVGVMMFVRDATDAAQYALLRESKTKAALSTQLRDHQREKNKHCLPYDACYYMYIKVPVGASNCAVNLSNHDLISIC